MKPPRILTITVAALFLAGCQTVTYVPTEKVVYDANGNPYTTVVQTPVTVDNTGQVAGAAIAGGLIGLLAGAAIAGNNHRPNYYRHNYRPNYNYHRPHYYRR